MNIYILKVKMNLKNEAMVTYPEPPIVNLY